MTRHSVDGVSAWQAARHALARILGSAADLLLPPLCLACRKRVGQHGRLCGPCFAAVDFITPPVCDRLGIPLPFDIGETQLSAAAIARPPVYDRARAVAHYSGVMRDLVHGLKYGDRHEGLPLFGRWMSEAGADIVRDCDLIVPVPLARLRLWSRRYNQAALLANALAEVSGKPCDPFVLERVRATQSQVGLSFDQRQRNVAGAFRVATEGTSRVRGTRILLVDDVVTTGATVEASARALRRAGASRVDVLSLARVVGPIDPLA